MYAEYSNPSPRIKQRSFIDADAARNGLQNDLEENKEPNEKGRESVHSDQMQQNGNRTRFMMMNDQYQ